MSQRGAHFQELPESLRDGEMHRILCDINNLDSSETLKLWYNTGIYDVKSRKTIKVCAIN